MKEKTNTGRAALAIALAALMSAVSTPAFSQTDGFFSDYTKNSVSFRDGDPTEVNGIWGTNTVTDYQTGEEVPVGNGLWLLAAAAVAYLAVRTGKKRRTTAMALLLPMALGLTQCRKPVVSEPAKPATTIDVSFIAGGVSRTDIDVTNGKITWNVGDKVYVTCGGKLVSATPLIATPMEDNNSMAVIEGTITTTLEIGDTPEFTFFYVGSGVEFSPTEGATTLTFNIADQRSHNGALIDDAGAYQIGRADTVRMKKDISGHYVPKKGNAKTFNPLTAVLYLDMSRFGTVGGDVVMTASKARNTMNVSLPTGAISYKNDGASDRRINFWVGSTACITVMEAAKNAAPEPNDTVRINFVSATETGSIGIKGGIEAGRVYAKVLNNTGHPIQVIPDSDIPQDLPEDWEDGENPHPFTVDPERVIHFSQANLQWTAVGTHSVATGGTGDGTWRFAEHQFDVVGNGNGSASPLYAGWIDLFGWGTSGYHQNSDTYNINYMPYSTSVDIVNETSNKYGYGPSIGTTPEGPVTHLQSAGQISGSYYDWGIYNAISNGGDEANRWQTLDKDEWAYLLNGRANASQLWGMGIIHDSIPGLIILPDDWTLPSTLSFKPGESDWDNAYDFVEWSLMEKAGAVFLTTGGWRFGTTVYSVLETGCYWSSNPVNASDCYSVYISGGHMLSQHTDQHRCSGLSVRLVRVVSASGGGHANGYGNGGNW